jgi:predicted ATPase
VAIVDAVRSNSFVITGTSGTGKTTLIEHLRARGFKAYEEPTRLILEQQLAINGNGLPARDPDLFLDLMLEYCVRCLDEAARLPPQITFFDRGIPDIAAYAVRFGVSPDKFYLAAREHRFNTTVFVLPPWKEIFVTDELRRKTFEEYREFHEMIVDAYKRVGCQLVEVPLASVEERVEYVLKEADRFGLP